MNTQKYPTKNTLDTVAQRGYNHGMKLKESTVRARIDPGLKEEVEKILNEMGISTTEAIRIFMNQIRLHKGIPYPLRVPNKSTEIALEETTSYKSLSSYKSAKDLRKDLDLE